MPRILVIHPSSLVREAHRTLLQACGWSVTEAIGRQDALVRLAGPAARRFGDLVLVDLREWTVPGTALVRALRRQLASSLPVLAILPFDDEAALATEAARRAGANLLLGADATPQAVATAVSLLTGQALPALARIGVEPPDDCPSLGEVWQQQLALLAVPDHAAATVVSARQAFELLLARRQDEGAAHAALTLTSLAGGPNPLRRWAAAFGPGQVNTVPADAPQRPRVEALLVVEAGGQRFGLPMAAPVEPACWWTDDNPLPGPAVVTDPPPVPLVQLLGTSGFRRLLATDRATVLLRRPDQADGRGHAIRVDEVLGLQPVELTACPDIVMRASGCVGIGRSVDGQPLLVLDPLALVSQIDRHAHSRAAAPR